MSTEYQTNYDPMVDVEFAKGDRAKGAVNDSHSLPCWLIVGRGVVIGIGLTEWRAWTSAMRWQGVPRTLLEEQGAKCISGTFSANKEISHPRDED